MAGAGPIVAFVISESNTVLKSAYVQMLNEFKGVAVFFDERKTAQYIHQTGGYQVLFTKSPDLVLALRGLGNMAYLVGVKSVPGVEARAAQALAFTNAGAQEVVGEFITKDIIEQVLVGAHLI